MKGLRNTPFVVWLALVASLVGHLAIQRHYERRNRTAFRTRHDEASSSHQAEGDGLFTSTDPAHLPVDSASGKRTLPDQKSASTILPEFLRRQGILQIGNPPSPVPSPVDGSPEELISADEPPTDAGDAKAVRSVIEQELSHTTREEREIWYDELKTLPAGVVRDLLQVRKQLCALPRLQGGVPEKLASADPAMTPNRSHEISAEPASQKIQFRLPDHFASLTALETAISQRRHNLTNALTPGFKRLRTTLIDAYDSSPLDATGDEELILDASRPLAIQGEGCRLAPLSIDLKQGSLKKTSRTLDLAIEGEGFFVVRRGDRQLLTRCGAFTLDRESRLCLTLTNELAVVEPAVTIADDVRELQISVTGTISATKPGESTSIVLGQLQLARVASPSRLQPVGSTLLAPNENTGPIQVGQPMTGTLGEIHQGFLENSNVESESELDEIAEILTVLKSLPSQNPRPATASQPQQAPTR